LLAPDPQLFWLNCLNTERCAIGHQQRWGYLTGGGKPYVASAVQAMLAA
jgi:hypothetical protein